MNRTDLQQLAELRVVDARTLLLNGQFAGAYYICGYAVECGLKACIARQIREHEYPPSANYSNQLFTHDLARLVVLADLSESLGDQMRDVPGFTRNWTVATRWTEQSRYSISAQQDAQELYDAVTAGTIGVLEWIKLHW